MNKTVILCLVLLLLIAASTGCKVAPPDAGNVATQAETVGGNVSSFNSTFSGNMDIVVTGGKNPSKLNMSLSGTNITDVSGDKSETLLDTKTLKPGATAMETMHIESYVSDKWQYLNIPVDTAKANTWYKTPVKDNDNILQSSQLAGALGLLKNATEVTYLSADKINGVSCYMITAKPDPKSTIAFMLSQAQTHYSLGLSDTDFSGIDYSKALQNVQIKLWVSRKDFKIIKATTSITLELTPEQLAASSGSFDTMTFSLNVSLIFSRYNSAVKITVPPDALNASELSPGS